MTQGRLSRRSEFTTVTSHSSTFVTWYHHKMSCQRESPRLLYRGENFTPVRNLATVSCKRETTTLFGVKLVCGKTGTGSAWVTFAILNHACIFINMKCTFKMTQSLWKRDTKSKSQPRMKLVFVFSCKHPLISFLGCIHQGPPFYLFIYFFLRQCIRILAME